MANPIQPQGQIRTEEAGPVRRGPVPQGVAEVPTTLTRAEGQEAGSGYIESFFIRLKSLVLWLIQWVFCARPVESQPREQINRQEAPHRLALEEDRREARARRDEEAQPVPGSHEENMLLLLRLQQKSDIEQAHILIQIGNQIYAKSGTTGFFTHFRQSYEKIGRDAVTTNPQLLKPFLQ